MAVKMKVLVKSKKKGRYVWRNVNVLTNNDGDKNSISKFFRTTRDVHFGGRDYSKEDEQ